MPTAFLLTVAAIGLDYGWEPLEAGGYEYIIQIEPELIDVLQAGEKLRSELPPFLRDVRSYRIQVGRGAVPRLGNPQAAVVPPQQPVGPPESVKQEPAASKPGERWNPYGEPSQPPASRTPRDNLRYPDFRTETPQPKLPTEPQLPRPVNDDTPRRFQPDQAATAMVKQTSGYGASEAKAAEKHNHEGGPSGSKPPIEAATAKPWLPLTFALLGLFVSLGGNAYLGLQWWEIRHRCQQLLRDRRSGRNATLRPRSSLADDSYSDGPVDEEDQDVRAISDDELPRSRRRRPGA